MTTCLEHSGVVAKIENLEGDMKAVAQGNLSAHKRIDGIKNWVIAGMTSLVLQMVVMMFKYFSKG